MIIWGWRGLTLSGKAGEFHCPGCNTERPYRMKKIQRFFTLYFIPLIPLQVLQESVECQTCKTRYVTAALHHNPKADREAARLRLGDAYQRILFHFGAMSGRRDPEFVDLIIRLYGGLDGGVLIAHEVEAGLMRNTNNIGPAQVELAQLVNERGREMVVKNALAAATADGALTESKRAELAALAKALGMSDTHFLGVLASQPSPQLT